MLRRYELTDEEWNQIVSLLPPENSGKQGRQSKCNRTILNQLASRIRISKRNLFA